MQKKEVQAPISEQKIFKIMLCLVYPVLAFFLVKNIVIGNMSGWLTTGIVIAVFSIALFTMKALKVKDEHCQLVAAIGLTFVDFVISMNSGACYSDDFLLQLAIIAMTALYFRPHYTIIQTLISDVLLAVMYVAHPEKAESLGQYIMCAAFMNLGAFLIFLMIKRGRAYIAISDNRALESESLLHSLKKLGSELRTHFEKSTESIEKIRTTRNLLDASTTELKQGSAEIVEGAQNVMTTCEKVRDKMGETGKQVTTLREDVSSVEEALTANRQNMEEMSGNIRSVRDATREIHEVFGLLAKHMQIITDVTKQLNSISSSTTMLSLNASIEAARAGQNGAGFAVVASKVRDLAVDSTDCSAQVAEAVNQMQHQIQETSRQLAENDQKIEASLHTLEELQNSFSHLTSNFDSLYRNIALQNNSVSEMDVIFGQLHDKISDVTQYTEHNRHSVESISEAILVYKDGVEKIVDDSRQVHELSENMIRCSEADFVK